MEDKKIVDEQEFESVNGGSNLNEINRDQMQMGAY